MIHPVFFEPSDERERGKHQFSSTKQWAGEGVGERARERGRMEERERMCLCEIENRVSVSDRERSERMSVL